MEKLKRAIAGIAAIACIILYTILVFNAGRKSYHEDLVNELNDRKENNAPLLIYPDSVFGYFDTCGGLPNATRR